MVVVDTFGEWLVIVIGALIALAVLYPAKADKLGHRVSKAIPHPTTVRKWLNKLGL